MAKKGGKLLGLLAIGAAAAGTYYYMKNKDSKIPENMDDDDLDNFDEDVDDGPTAKPTEKRAYTNLDFNTVEKKVKDTVVKFADTADKTASKVSDKLQGCATKIEEFFDDKKTVDETEIPVDCESEEVSEEDYVEEESFE